MASAFRKTKDAVKNKFGKGKGKRQVDDTQEDQEKEAQRMSEPLTASKKGFEHKSESLPDVVRDVQNENAPISQPSMLGQKSSVGSKKSDLKSARGSLDSGLSDLNLQDVLDQKFPKSSKGGVPAATAKACGNNHQVATDDALEKHRCDLTSTDIGEPSNPESATSNNGLISNAVNTNQELNASGISGKPPNPNSGTSGDGITHSEETHSQVPNVPDPANTGEVPTDPNSEASGDGITHSEETHSQELNVPDAANADGEVPTDPNSEASGDGIAHSEEIHSQELNVPHPANTDGDVPTVPNSEASGDGITHSEETHSQVPNVPDPANADELVDPNPNNEASGDEDSVSGHEHRSQEINAASAGVTEVPNLNEEATVPAAAAAETRPPQPDETNLESLTGTSIQEEAEDTVDEGATGDETAQQEEAANRYDHLYVSDVMQKDKFVEDKLAPQLDHTSNRAIKTWEHLACTDEVNTPLETRLRCKLNNQYSCTLMLIDFIAVKMKHKTVQDLIAALKAIKRNDVVRIIAAVYPENSTKTISDFASSDVNTKMINEMATMLDQRSWAIGYWIDLGREFKISGDKLKEIEYGQFNPALALMEYLYSKQEDLTVRKFYEEVEKLEREDVLKKLHPFLVEHSEELMEEVMELESDVVRGICVYLNNPNRALKNWRHLANAFNVPREIYKDFNPEKPLSPTKVLFEWIFAKRNDLTVGQLRAALKSIERNDVVRDLRKYLDKRSTGGE